MSASFVVDVANWPVDEEHPYYPEGSRDKQLLRCPEPTPHDGLIAHHRYQFKQSRRAYPDQFWAEIVAYRLGLLTGVPVPPAYPAWDSRNDVCGALIEWFYGYVERPSEGFLSGGLFMKAAIRDYDMKRGQQHNFATIEILCNTLARRQTNPISMHESWPQDWARILTFDALIGNTDRHHENWGLIIDRARTGQTNTRLAPAFDNGTSLGHERFEQAFRNFESATDLERYVARGTHHMRWLKDDLHQAGHAELLLKLAEKHPQTQATMLAVLDFDFAAFERELEGLTQLSLPVPLSPARAGFMLRLTLARRNRLFRTLTS